MAVENNLTTETLGVAKSLDYAQQFVFGVKNLQELMGITRAIPMAEGTLIKTYKTKATMADGNVAKGEIVPLSKVEKDVDQTYELEFKKFRKAVPAEDIQKFGYDEAVIMTDLKMLEENKTVVRNDIFEVLKTGKGSATGKGLQKTMAQVKAALTTAFDGVMTKSIAFINPYDLADYLGDHTITTETQFGLEYIKNFLGFNVVIVTSSVDKGKVYATVANNLQMAYAKIGGELTKAFKLETDSECPLIGVGHDINTERFTAETVTMFAIKLFPEVTNGVIVGTIQALEV